MNDLRFVGFIGPSYVARSRNIDCQRCINLIPELNELGTGKDREVAALVGTPGLKLRVLLPTSPVRGLYTSTKGVLYAVGGNKLYKISNAWAATEIGTLLTATGPISMVDDGTTLVVVDGPNGYKHVLGSTTTTQIVDDAWLGASQVAYMDAEFIFTEPNSGRIYIVGGDFVFDATERSTAEGSPDDLVAMIVNRREICLFGAKSTEFWYDSGNVDFPFERIQGAYIDYGCSARGSVAKANNTVFWLGESEQGGLKVFMANGYQAQPVSTTAVELAIQSYGDVSGATAYSYEDSGHQFYVLNFAQATWVYDIKTSLWHERSWTLDGTLYRHRGNYHAAAYSKHVIGDWENGKVYTYEQDQYSDDGAVISRVRVAPHLSSDMKNQFFSSFQLDIEAGTGLDGLGQGVDPQVMLTWSDDGGHTWSNELWTGCGRIGNTTARAMWRKLGRARDRVFKVVITDPVKVTILGAELDFKAAV